MKVVIVEDEKPAAEKLERLLKRYDPEIEILAKLENVKKAVNWFENQAQELDLVFMDIQLTDGLSFEIFNKINLNKPIIFTTAFNEYTLEAFKVNSIAYLLKPITYDALAESLDKLEKMRESLQQNAANSQIQQISEALSLLKKNYKNRFMVKLGEHIRSVAVEKIALFYAEGRNVFLITLEQKKFIIDYKMEELQGLLDPALFFRVNRSISVNINAIKDVLIYSNSRLKVTLEVETEKEIIVSRDRVIPFKEWFDDAV